MRTATAASQEVDMNDSNKDIELAQAPAEVQAAAEAPKTRRPRTRKPAEKVTSVEHEAGAPAQEPLEQTDTSTPAPIEAMETPQRLEHRDGARKHGRRGDKPAPHGDGYRFADVVSGQFDQDEGDAEVVPH